MTLREILTGGSAALLVLLTLVQVAPIKVNPWSAIAKGMGRAFNADVLKSLEEVKAQQQASQKRLADHIKVDDQRDADRHRERILRFNNELLRDIGHTREDFIEILAVIDSYERYCKANTDYKNNRAVHAIANIGRVYDERLQKHDFLRE